MSRWSFLPELTPFDRIALDALAVPEPLAAGATLIREGDRPEAVFLLERGELRVSMRRDGVDRTVTDLAAPALVGEMSFTSGDPASATVVATQDCQVRRLSRRSLDQRTAGDPGLGARFYRALARVIAERLRGYAARWLGTDEADDGEIEHLVVRLSSLHEEDLPAEAERWTTRYARVGKRPGYLWRWTWQGIREVAIDPSHEDLAVTKLMLTILHALIADHQGSQAPAALAAAGGVVAVDARPSVQMIAELALAVDERARALPGGERLAPVFQFDRDATLQALRFSALHRRYPALTNTVDLLTWGPHASGLIACGTLDAMAADLDDAGHGVLREAMHAIAGMQRIAQDTAHWRRDVSDGAPDCLAAAIGRDLGVHGAPGHVGELLTRLEGAGVEARLHELWRGHRRRLAALSGRHPAIDVARLTRGADRLVGASLAARGA